MYFYNEVIKVLEPGNVINVRIQGEQILYKQNSRIKTFDQLLHFQEIYKN